ncbi:Uncharacterised protein [Cedecea lapagei]|uniref:Uncharacterized protein n=1 Tax=Cedecea lapagei TaxID=158823 RepID=A0A3S4MGU0_9ENTR|nr:Uncharacterised protein [Cedecea lapagei]
MSFFYLRPGALALAAPCYLVNKCTAIHVQNTIGRGQRFLAVGYQ